MDQRPPFFNTQFNPHYNYQPSPQIDSQPHSQPSQYDFQTFSQQYMFNSQYPPAVFNPQFCFGQSQSPSNQPSQTNDSQPRSTQRKKNTQTQQKERNPNWSKEEDEALCKAWIRVSEDAVTGADQQKGRLWDRILGDFNIILGCETNRVSTALMNRWSLIQSHLNKYSGYVRMVERYPGASGSNAEDKIGAIKQLYYDKEKHHFKWDGCWLLLKDNTKWYNYTKDQEQKKEKIAQRKRIEINLDDDEVEYSSNPSTPATNPPTPVTTPGSGSHNDNDSPFNQGTQELPRPPGRKAMKNARRKKNDDAMNLIAEEFSNLRKEQKEIAEKEIIMTREREQLKIQAKQEQERMRIAAKLETEKMKIEAKQEQERMRWEREIMMTDPNLVPTEEGRAWIIQQQKSILVRGRQGSYGGGSSDNGE